jgi:ATP-dependent helicase HrpB
MLPMTPMNLSFPIEKELPALNAALAASRRVVLSAPPGAGKTVRVPLALLESLWMQDQKIILLEPRRLAARRAAEFMALQLGETVGETVGYRIRGDSVVCGRTRIEVVTEGILTRILHSQPDLPGVGLVIFDEFHERSLHADIGLALTLDVQRHLREDLRVLVMSATLDGVAVARLLGDAPIISGDTVSFPIETRYSRFTAEKPLEIRVVEAIERALTAGEGDLLVFLPGMREIRRVEEGLWNRLPEDVSVRLLHGDLPARIQDAALAPAPSGGRKIVLSTSIAETSLTIEGVQIVVDAGLARVARFDPHRGMSSLATVPVSRAVADQRRGRAGRTGPGLCFRLWTESEHQQLPEYPVPEIRASDLAHLALDLASWGSPDGAGLCFLDPPHPAHLAQAQDLLFRLGAMDRDKKLTAHGRAMAQLPIHPRYGHMILKAKATGWGSAACELAALLDESELLTGAGKNEVNLANRLDTLRDGRGINSSVAVRIKAQRRRLMQMADIAVDDQIAASTGLLVAWAYPDRIGKKRPDRSNAYQLTSGMVATLPASPMAREEFIAIADADAGATEGRVYLAAPLDRRELEAAFADEFTVSEEVRWDDREGRVQSARIRQLGALAVDESPFTADGEKIALAMIDGIRRRGLQCLPWDAEANRFHERAQWAARISGSLVDYSDAALLDGLEIWLMPYLAGMSRLDHLQRLPLNEALRARLTPRQQREMDRCAPSHCLVPSGSRIRLEYTAGDQVVLAVKLQELFGLVETPRVGGGAVPVTIHLLSPAARPLAVTQDLPSFWKNTYPEIRKQLRARYPKHPWPEDPLTAEPTRRTRRANR